MEIRSSLMRFLSRYLSSRASIEDVVQDAYLHVLEAQKHTDIADPKAYLYRTSRNIALKELEKSMNRLTDRVEDSVLESILYSEIGPQDEYEARQKFELFCQAVRLLPVGCRRVYILRKVYGLTQQEIARRLNISEKTVEAHIAKGAIRCMDFMKANQALFSAGDTRERERAKTIKYSNG